MQTAQSKCLRAFLFFFFIFVEQLAQISAALMNCIDFTLGARNVRQSLKLMLGIGLDRFVLLFALIRIIDYNWIFNTCFLNSRTVILCACWITEWSRVEFNFDCKATELKRGNEMHMVQIGVKFIEIFNTKIAASECIFMATWTQCGQFPWLFEMIRVSCWTKTNVHHTLLQHCHVLSGSKNVNICSCMNCEFLIKQSKRKRLNGNEVDGHWQTAEKGEILLLFRPNFAFNSIKAFPEYAKIKMR